MRKHQGDFSDSRNTDDLCREYESFFMNDVDDVLQGIPKQDRNEARVQLCTTFEVTSWNDDGTVTIVLRKSAHSPILALCLYRNKHYLNEGLPHSQDSTWHTRMSVCLSDLK